MVIKRMSKWQANPQTAHNTYWSMTVQKSGAVATRRIRMLKLLRDFEKMLAAVVATMLPSQEEA
jgi:hypothetical protein